jgi:hypothetical protein
MQAVENKEVVQDDGIEMRLCHEKWDEARNVRIQGVDSGSWRRSIFRQQAFDCCWKLRGTSSFRKIELLLLFSVQKSYVNIIDRRSRKSCIPPDCLSPIYSHKTLI